MKSSFFIKLPSSPILHLLPGLLLGAITGAAQSVSTEMISTALTENSAPIQLEMVIHRPAGAGPFPVVVFNHGSTGNGNDPKQFPLTWTNSTVANYFTARGWIVMFPQRRGRGRSGGTYAEGLATNGTGYTCNTTISLAGMERALTDIDEVVRHLRDRADVIPHRMIIAGQSRGGILSIVYAGSRPGVFLGAVNFVGGWMSDSCPNATELNTVPFARGGAFAGPTLWLYGENDPFYSMAHSRNNHRAFTTAGGRGEFNAYQLGSGISGHNVINYVSQWGPAADRFMAGLESTAGSGSGLPSPSRADLNATYTFSTLAGAPSLGDTDGAGTAARFSSPTGLATDVAGNIYVADTVNHLIRKITPAGVVTRLAGLPGQRGAADGPAAAARFNTPLGVAVDTGGNILVADTGNATIRRISPAGVVTTLAGSAGQQGSADGPAASARFQSPAGLAVDGQGNLFVADQGAHTLRRISSGGVVATLAGTAFAAGTSDGNGAGARFNQPRAVAVASSGTVYVADESNHTIRAITPDGTTVTLAGAAGQRGQSDGRGIDARFDEPAGLALDQAGSLFAVEAGGRLLRKIGAQGDVATVLDPVASRAALLSPEGLARDQAGNLYIADSTNHTVQRISLTGEIAAFAGSGNSASTGNLDGAGSAARFHGPTGLGLGPANEIYVADQGNRSIRRISPSGLVTTVTTGLVGPVDVAADAGGTLFVADAGRAIRRISRDGMVTTLAGDLGAGGSVDGIGGSARFQNLSGLVVDPSGNVWATDGETIRRITPAGAVTTLAGARFRQLAGIALDSTGTIYVADRADHTVSKITAAGVVTGLAGLTGQSGESDGTGTSARFHEPTGVAVDATGIVFIADQGNTLIRRIAPDGGVTTLGGRPGAFGSADGAAEAARFARPSDIAVDNVGVLYVVDRALDANVIRLGRRTGVASLDIPATQPATPPATTPVPAGPSSTPSASAGGGGAPSWWMLGSLFVVTVGRFWRKLGRSRQNVA